MIRTNVKQGPLTFIPKKTLLLDELERTIKVTAVTNTDLAQANRVFELPIYTFFSRNKVDNSIIDLINQIRVNGLADQVSRQLESRIYPVKWETQIYNMVHEQCLTSMSFVKDCSGDRFKWKDIVANTFGFSMMHGPFRYCKLNYEYDYKTESINSSNSLRVRINGIAQDMIVAYTTGDEQVSKIWTELNAFPYKCNKDNSRVLGVLQKILGSKFKYFKPEELFDADQTIMSIGDAFVQTDALGNILKLMTIGSTNFKTIAGLGFANALNINVAYVDRANLFKAPLPVDLGNFKLSINQEANYTWLASRALYEFSNFEEITFHVLNTYTSMVLTGYEMDVPKYLLDYSDTGTVKPEERSSFEQSNSKFTMYEGAPTYVQPMIQTPQQVSGGKTYLTRASEITSNVAHSVYNTLAPILGKAVDVTKEDAREIGSYLIAKGGELVNYYTSPTIQTTTGATVRLPGISLTQENKVTGRRINKRRKPT